MAGDDDSIAVLGANGMLGSDLVKALKNTGKDVDAYDLGEFDIADAEQLCGVVNSHKTIINYILMNG